MSQHPHHEMHANSLSAHQEERSAGRLSKRSVAIVEVLAGYRPITDSQLTDRQVMEQLGFTDMNSVRPRISELIRSGQLEECGSVRDPETGKNVRLVRIKRKAENMNLF